ncbi:MAG: anti-sigma factor [Acidimicrobiia bacterium]|nr:anti-sigma factor [Acidimicrobiia bacterium]
MARELTPSEIEELFGVYALDALDADERAEVDTYLERSVAARTEVAELEEVAAMLAHSGGAAPDGIWGRIEQALAAEPPRLVLPLDQARTERSRRRGFGGRVALAIAGASAAAALVTAVVVSSQMSAQEDRLDRVASSVEHDGMRRAAMGALADPRARTVRLKALDGAGSATVVSMPDGGGFLMAHGVARRARGRTYQLWAMTGDPGTPGLVSAGVLGRELDIAAFHAPASAHGFVVTEEAEPGAPTATGHVMLAGEFA